MKMIIKKKTATISIVSSQGTNVQFSSWLIVHSPSL